MYPDIKNYLKDIKRESCEVYSNGKVQWDIYEFGNKLGSWKGFRRCVATSLSRECDGQGILDLSGPDSIIYTNIGTNFKADETLKNIGLDELFEAKSIVQLSHARGADELIHRSLKELATTESLPFKIFDLNKAYYHLLAISHFLYETYKEDICFDSIDIRCYPNTFRRALIDFAGEVVKGARNITLRVSAAMQETYDIKKLWRRCINPPVPILMT